MKFESQTTHFSLGETCRLPRPGMVVWGRWTWSGLPECDRGQRERTGV